MASQIDPDPKQKAAPKPAAPPAKPATAGKPAAAPAKPAAAAKPPVAAKPAAPAKPVAAVAAAEPAAASDESPVIAERRGGGMNQMIACGISMLVHIVALLSMALIVTATPEKEKPREIVSTAAETVEEFEEFTEQEIDQPVSDAPQSNDVVVPTTDAVVPDVQVVSTADAVEAAPLAVELTDFGSETAPATDLASSMGVVGGTGGGFGGRANAGKMAAASGGGADTEQAVDRALKWIAIHQMPDGSWSFDLTKCPSCQGQCSHSGNYPDPAGATAMALLPFLGRGYTHREGPYKAQIEQGIAYLAARAIANKGKIYGPGSHSLYVQGLAGIALSECYAMTQDPRLQVPTQLALNHIMDAQDPRGGGWRYTPKMPGDTSAVGWQLMALKSGNMAYLQVNPLVIKKAVEFLDSVQVEDGAFYGYADPGKNHPGCTAVGLLCRMYLGWKKDHPALQRGVDYLAKLGPSKDLYFNYYATQIMHHFEGDMWIAWNNKMKGMLLKAQSREGHEAGSFYDGVDGGHGAHSGGRLYCTALSTMILEVYYRHLPIYQNQSVDEEFKE